CDRRDLLSFPTRRSSDLLSYRLDQNSPYNTVFAVKNIPFSSIGPNATYSGAKVLPSGVQPDLKTPTVESWSFKIEDSTVGVFRRSEEHTSELQSLAYLVC